MTEREKMLAGQPYDPSDEELVRDRQRARRVLRHYSESREDEPFERTRLLRKLFGSCGEKIVRLLRKLSTLFPRLSKVLASK